MSFFGVSDLSPSLARLKMRGTLGTGELLDIARVLESVKNAVSYGVRMEDDPVSYTHLSENDYSMLSIPGIHSVAMENACDMIRNICVYQTLSLIHI